MAVDTTGLLASSSLTIKKWSSLTQRENYEENFFHARGFSGPASKSMGKPEVDGNYPILIYTDLERGQNIRAGQGLGKNGTGDTVTIGWRNKLTGTRVTGNSTLEAGEEELTWGYSKVIIDQWRHAGEIIGIMSSKRVIDATKDEIRMALKDYAVDKDEEDMWAAIYNGASEHLTDLTHYTATAHPNTFVYDGRYGVGSAKVASLDTEDIMSSKVLDYMLRWYSNKSNPISKVRTPYKQPVGLVILSDAQYEDLCDDNKFWSLQKDALVRAVVGKMTDHPLFSTAEAYYRGLFIHHTTRIWDSSEADITPQSTELHGAVCLGARAIGCANGGFGNESLGDDDRGNVMFRFMESDSTDYGNLVKVGIHVINGKRRMDFTQADATGAASGAADKNQSSGIFWTATKAHGFA